MEFRVTYLPEFSLSLQKLPKKHGKQIVKKIKTILEIKDLNIFGYIKPLALPIGRATHRLKMSEYRIFVRVEGNNFEFHNIVKRADAYKK